MISDGVKGNITTIATWIISLFFSYVGVTSLTGEDIAGLVGVVVAIVVNYNNMKFNNTIMEPENAVVGENGGEWVVLDFGDDDDSA